MIAWLNPAALWGLLALAGPVAVHLLRRDRTARVPFPSLRFVVRSPFSAVRPRRLSDLGLLAVRASIIAAVALAAAQPVVITPAREQAWDARLAKAIVVDRSESMPRGAADQPAAAEAQGAAFVLRVDAADLGGGLAEAVKLLVQLPPARREILVVSDFQLGSIADAHIAQVPPSIGVRFVRVGAAPVARDFRVPMFGGAHSSVARVQLAGPATSVTIEPPTETAAGLQLFGAPGSDAALVALQRVVAAAGAPAPSADEPMVVSFEGARAAENVQTLRAPWMLRTVLAMQQDTELRALGAQSAGDADGPWMIVLAARDGRPLLRAAADGRLLVLAAAAKPSDLVAAAMLRAALLARVAAPPVEQEILTISAQQLERWSRPGLQGSPDAWRHVEPSDARWFWGLALVLLGVEAALRRRSCRDTAVEAHAA